MAAPWRGVFPGTWTPSDAAFFTTPPGMLVSEAMLGSAASDATSIALSATEGADLASATARLAVSANLAAVDGADLASSAVAEVVSASLSAVDGADLCASSMDVVEIQSTFALDATEGADMAEAVAVASVDSVEQGVDQTVYGMGGIYSFGGSSVPVEDDDETLDGFLRAVPLVPATPQPVAPKKATIAAGPTDLDRAMLPIVSKPAPAKAVPDLQTLASQEAEALRKKHHNHALRLLLLAS